MKTSSCRFVAWLALLPAVLAAGNDTCRCTPDQACWPTDAEWAAFNKTIGGQLIKTTPVMQPCYVGPDANNATCQYLLREGFHDSDYEAAQPLGYCFPLDLACVPPTSALTQPVSQCQRGPAPAYAINATSENIISQGIKFAAQKNIRVVIKSTGHDLLQRSTGSYGLSIWLYHFRDGFEFKDHNTDASSVSVWKGSTLTIKGGYPWSDLYPSAKAKGIILVGGNQRGPCSTGGWTQGGGHSPVTRNYGIGADQVLSARVVLASGKVVTANAQQNADLFFAIRGGGPGTYGVVTEIVVKTYPTRTVNLFEAVLTVQGVDNTPRFLDAMTTVYSSYNELSQAGFGGYGYWASYLPIPFLGYNATNVWTQSYTILDRTPAQAQKLFKPFQDRMNKLNLIGAGFNLNITHTTYQTYGDYYDSKKYTVAEVGGISALSSRLLDADALSGKRGSLRDAMDTMAGQPDQIVSHTLVHHGLEAAPGLHGNVTAVQPGWYASTLLDIFEIGVQGFSQSDNEEGFSLIRNKVYPVYQKLSPNTGTYMNEADWGEKNWKQDFYGKHFDRLSQIKARYDPNGLFYCPTCVGSEAWTTAANGALCKV